MQDVALKLESIRDDFREKYWHKVNCRLGMGGSEIKGAKWAMGERPFVKEVVGVDRAGRPVKRTVRGNKSYSEARGTGARGVFYWYSLRQGCCYFIQEQVSRTRSRRYYAFVNAGALHEIGEADAAAFVASTVVADEREPTS